MLSSLLLTPWQQLLQEVLQASNESLLMTIGCSIPLGDQTTQEAAWAVLGQPLSQCLQPLQQACVHTPDMNYPCIHIVVQRPHIYTMALCPPGQGGVIGCTACVYTTTAGPVDVCLQPGA